MAKKKEDPAKVAQRKEERVAFVQGHPLLQPEQARQQFYVQTRAQELGAAGKPVDRAQLRENFQTGNIQREGFYTPGDISRIAAQQQNNNTSNNTSNDSNTPTPTPDSPAGPVYSGGQPTTPTTPSNDYVVPERTTALGGKIPAAVQFRMDSAGASGFGKTGESRLVADTPPNQFANRTDASGLSGMGKTQLDPNKTYNVPGPDVLMRGAEDTNSDSYLELRANNDETTLSEYQSQFPAWYKPNAAQLASQKFMTRHSRMTPEEIKDERRQAVANRYGAGVLAAEVIAGTAAAVAGAPVAGIVAAGALGVGLASKVFGEIRQSETGLTDEEINRTALIQGGISLAAGAAFGVAGTAISKALPKIKPALTGIKNWADTPGEAQPIVGLVNKIKLLNKEPIALPVRPPFQSNPMFPGEQLALPRGDSYTSFVEPPAVKPITGADRLENAAAVVAKNKGEVAPPVISGQSLADSKPVSSIETALKEDGVTELTPRQVAARLREAKKKEARLAAAEAPAVAPSTPQSALSQEPIGAAASDPNLSSPTALNPSGKITVAEMQSSVVAKDPYAGMTQAEAAASRSTGYKPAPKIETSLVDDIPVKNPNRNKALIMRPGDEFNFAWDTSSLIEPKYLGYGRRDVLGEEQLFNDVSYNFNEIVMSGQKANEAQAADLLRSSKEELARVFGKENPPSVFEDIFTSSKLTGSKPTGQIASPKKPVRDPDADEAAAMITGDQLDRARLENVSMGRLIKDNIEIIRTDRATRNADRIRDYENRRYPNIDDMSGRPVPTPDANKPVTISLEDAIKQGQNKGADAVDQGLVEAKRLFEETGVAPKRGSDYLLNKKGEIYKVKKQNTLSRAENLKASQQKQNVDRKVSRAVTSGKIDVATAKEVLSNKPGTVTLNDAIKQGTAKEVSEPELGPFLINGDLYTYKTFPKTKAGPLGATGRQTDRAKAALTEPIYPRGLPDNAPFGSVKPTMSAAQEKMFATRLKEQTNIFARTGKPTKLEDLIRADIKAEYGQKALNKIDLEAGTGLGTTVNLPTAVTEPTIGAAIKPKFLPSGKIQGETLDEQIANWTKYSNSEGFKTLSLTNPQKYTEIVNANALIDDAVKTRVNEALAKQSAFKLQMPSKSGKSITKSDDPWQKSLVSEAGPMPTKFAGGTKDVRSTDPVLATDRAQNLPYGAEINPPDPNKWVPKEPEPISIDASKEQQIQFNRDIAEYGEELKGTGPESILRARVPMNLENQTALREQAAAMPNSPLKRETIKELNTFNRTNYPNETYPGFGNFGKNPILKADEYLNTRTNPWQSSNPQKRIVDPGDTFEKFSKSRAGKGKTEADYAVAKAEYDSKLAALEAEPRGFTGDVEPFVGRFSPEQNQSLEAWSASQQVTEATPRTTVSIDELTAGSTNEARVAMEEDAFQRAEDIAAQVKFKAAQEAERTNYFNTRTERGDFDLMREGFARQDANKAAIPKPPTREEVLKTGVIRRLKTRIAEKEAADAAAAQAAARADAEEMLPLNVDQYYRERWDQSNPWVVQARQGYQARIDQSGLTNLETRYTSNRPRGLYRGPQPAAPTPEIPVPRSEVSNAAPVSPGVQLRQSAANRDEWLAANEKLKGTPDYIYERSAGDITSKDMVDEVNAPDMTEAITSIKDEAAANAAETTKEYEGFDYTAFD